MDQQQGQAVSDEVVRDRPVWPRFMAGGKPVGIIEISPFMEEALSDEQKARIVADAERKFASEVYGNVAAVIEQVTSGYLLEDGIASEEQLLHAATVWQQSRSENV